MHFLITFLIAWLLNALSLWLAAAIVPGVRVKSFKGAMLGALALGFVSVVVAPILTLLSLPLTVLTLGLFLFVLVGLLFWLGAGLVPDFEVDGCLAGFLGAVVLSIINWLMGLFFNFSSWW
ncbi:MAG: phage holin family protein, partial [Candidatus Eremiobacteraeota bacterium]|nr:phage holin family protein [Candidatus Eremiobacteraeota bacterium]